MKLQILSGVLLLSTFIFSCKKETTHPASSAATLAPLSIEFDNIVGGENLYLENRNYVNASGETFTIDYLQYFVSNIKLTNAEGAVYTVPQDSSYFLIKEHDAAFSKAHIYVPEGDYTQLTFTLGVDSVRNTLGIDQRLGILDPTNTANEGMYWGWNSGYIFFKMEGTSSAAPEDGNGLRKYRYHIGGFGGYNSPTINNVKTITIDLKDRGIAKVRTTNNANIHLMVDVSQVFDGPTRISIAQNATVMFADFSTIIADNYAKMFFHDHTEN